MKKSASVAIALLAVSLQAANINWSIGSMLYGVTPDGTATQAYSSTAGWYDAAKNGSFVLVYLGVNADAISASDIGKAGITSTIVDTISISDIVLQSGRASNQGKANVVQTKSVDNVAGATYQVFWLNNGTYGDIFTDSAMTSPAQNTVKITYDGMAYAANPSPFYAAGGSSTSAYVAVPEPATGALALAGVALLFRRRRA